MLEDSLITDYASLVPHGYLPEDYNIWYVGINNSIDNGIDSFLTNLNKHGHIIIGEPELVDYIYEGSKKELMYVILYKSLPNLEYLEYKWQEKVDKNA